MNIKGYVFSQDEIDQLEAYRDRQDEIVDLK